MFRRESADEDDSESLELVTPGIAWDDGSTSSTIPPAPRAEHVGDGHPDQPPARRRPSRWWVVAVVGALVIVAFVFGGRDRTKSAVPPFISTPDTLSRIPPIGQPRPNQTISPALTDPSTTEAPATETPATETPTTVPSTTAPPTTVGDSVGPIYPNNSDLGLFFADPNNYGADSYSGVRIELATGVVQKLESSRSSGYGASGVFGSGIEAHLLSLSDLDGLAGAPCSDGSWWVINQDGGGHLGSLRRVRPHHGSLPDVVQTIGINPQLRTMQAWSVSTTADDRPVFVGPDRRSYALDPATGTLTRLGKGPVGVVQRGSYVETVCGDDAQCSEILHGSHETTVTLASSPGQLISFSPDGLHALVLQYAADDFAVPSNDPSMQVLAVRLVDMRSGDVVTLSNVPSAVSRMLIQNFSGAGWAQWTPDSALAILADGQQLLRVDIAARTASTIPLPSIVSGMTGVGIA